MKPWVIVVGLVLAALVIAAIEFGWPWWQARQLADEPAPVAQASDDPPASATAPPAAIDPEPVPQAANLPALDDSDAEVLAGLAAWSVPEHWLQQEQLLRRLASLIDNVARRELPRSQLQFLAPVGRFSASQDSGRLTMSAASHRRFDAHLDALEAIAPADAAQLFEFWSPRLDEAFRELGRPDADSVEIALQAIDRVLGISPPPQPAELVRPTVAYEYADPELEALPALDKQLLRIGPDNLARLQRWLEELRPLLQS